MALVMMKHGDDTAEADALLEILGVLSNKVKIELVWRGVDYAFRCSRFRSWIKRVRST
jgi:hypothetical protein